MKQDFNYHGHTKRCGHAIGEDEEYVLEAIKAGFKRIGFSDHMPYQNGYSAGERMHEEELSQYVASIKSLQMKYMNRIDICIGLEFEYYQDQLQEIRKHKETFDYLILGQHGSSLYEDEFYTRNTDEDVLLYASLVQKACEEKLPLYIAHPDLFMFSKEEWTPACDQATRLICESAQKYHIPLELNLNGLKYGKRCIGKELRYPYPYRNFWEIVQEYNIDCLYGLDAHTPLKYADTACFEIVDEEIIYGLKLHKITDLKVLHKM